MILFWQFTIQTLNELDIVSNQHISIEMFLLRLIHLKDFKPKDESEHEIHKLIKEKKQSKKYHIKNIE